MNSYYKQSIGVFSIGIPLFLIVVVAGVALYSASSVSDDYKVKKKKYDAAQAAMNQIMEMQGQSE